MPKLTDKLVRALPLTSKGQTITRDTELKGFFVRVGKRSRTYTVAVDVTTGGKRRTITRAIGDAATLGASQARNKAMAEIASIKDGKTTRSAPEPREEATPITLGGAWQSYRAMLSRKVEDGRRSHRTLASYVDLCERVLADLLDVPLVELASPEGRARVADLHREIGKLRGRVIANRAAAMIERIYRHADDYDLAPDLPRKGPTRQVEYFRETRRNNALSPADLPGWNKVRRALSNPVRREFHLITLLTGMRPTALKAAKWSDLDMTRRVLHVPEPKGGADRHFDLPLSRAILAAMARARRAGRVLNGRAAQTYIFPTVRGPGHVEETQEKGRSAPVGFAYGNQLRQSFAGFGRLAGVPELHMKILMNHAGRDVSQGYVSDAAMVEDVARSQEKISKYILQEMST